jgi:hypothetical protein
MKSILLTKGYYAHVDDEWYEWLMGWEWHYNHGYASRYDKGATVWMHRIINNTPDGLQTDHIDGDKLNNQGLNLRSVCHKENNQNRGMSKNNTSGYKGVTPYRGKFRAYIGVNKKNINLGAYDTPEEASLVYKEACSKYFGEYVRK